MKHTIIMHAIHAQHACVLFMHVFKHLKIAAQQVSLLIKVHCTKTFITPEKGVGICKGVPIRHPVWGGKEQHK